MSVYKITDFVYHFCHRVKVYAECLHRTQPIGTAVKDTVDHLQIARLDTMSLKKFKGRLADNIGIHLAYTSINHKGSSSLTNNLVGYLRTLQEVFTALAQ